MKLRYQMRGLGIGIVVTALLMGVAERDRIPLSDAEIREAALGLGMVDGNSLTLGDLGNTASSSMPKEPAATSLPETESTTAPAPTSEAEPATAPTPTSEAQSMTTSSANPDKDSAQLPESERESGESSAPESDGESMEGSEDALSGVQSRTVTLVIESGETSYVICQRMENAGLIEDAASFDTYLCNIGYSRKIKDGTYEISFGTSEEEIAKIITKTQ